MSEISKERRLRMLDEKLHDGEAIDIEDFIKFLWEEYEIVIDRRTIQRDMKELKRLLADRYMDDKSEFLYKEKGAYKYKEECFAFDETVLIEPTELGQLLKYNPNFITDMETELEKKLATIIKEYTDSEDSKISWHPVVYQNKMNEGHKNFTKVLKYINQQIPVEITHQALGAEYETQQRYILLLLKVLDNNFARGWYVLAQRLIDGEKEIKLDINQFNIIALDRITGIKSISKKIEIITDKGFDPNDYFKDTIKGLMRNNLNKQKDNLKKPTWGELYKENIYRGPEKIKLKIPDKKNWICKYFEKYPIHPSQFHRTDEQSFYIELNVEVDLDLENLIYMYSKELIVIEPEYLRKNLIQRIKTALKNYS